MTTQMHEFKHFHLFCGLGGGAKGFNKGHARVGNMEARFRCIGGIDNDKSAIKDFDKLSGVKGTVMDLFSVDQYIAFHGKMPPESWREASPADIRAAAGNEDPNIIFLSAPCKGFSGLLSETRSKTDKYQALNQLTLRGVWLSLEAWKNNPVELYVFENVPRIATRGRSLLDQIIALLRSYGYAVAETTHDCGELGGLAQSRKRFLLVARHIAKVPPFLYEPEKRNLRAVGEILGRMPVPGGGAGGAMHRVPALQWKTWVRLAFVEAGSDWRSLNKLNVVDGKLADFLIVPEGRNDFLGVQKWSEASGTVSGASRPGNGNFSIADPRFDQSAKWTDGQAYGVRKWDEPTGAVTSKNIPGQGPYSVADPRVMTKQAGDNFYGGGEYGVNDWAGQVGAIKGNACHDNGKFAVADPRVEGDRSGPYGVSGWNETAKTIAGESFPTNGGFAVQDPRMKGETDDTRHKNVFRIVRFDQSAGTISSGHGPSSGGQCVADPRHAGTPKHSNEFRIVPWAQPGGAVTGAHGSGQCVADPRGGLNNDSGKYKVTEWEKPSGCVIGGDDHGAYAVADPRGTKDNAHHNVLHVTPWDGSAKTITASMHPGGGAMSIADPRAMHRAKGDNFLTGGHYGVLPWNSPAMTISAHGQHDNGWNSVADPRMPEASENIVAVIRAIDGTWHRPFTTLELAALQSLVDPEEHFELEGLSDSAWRERIGNAVPPEAAAAIAGVMGTTLLLALSGETFMLSAMPIWVQPVAIALSVKPQEFA